MTNLEWLSQSDFEDCIQHLLRQISDAYEKSEQRIIQNVQDPFLLLCLAHIHHITNKDELMTIQKIASVSSGVSNAIGHFHQNILGKIKGFRNHDAGYDIECSKRKILAEIKNKHNTMNASNRMKVIDDLKTAIRMKPGYTGYLVVMIPKKPQKYRRQLAPNVFEIDGTSFYELATGQSHALAALYEAVTKRLCKNQRQIITHCLDIFQTGIAP